MLRSKLESCGEHASPKVVLAFVSGRKYKHCPGFWQAHAALQDPATGCHGSASIVVAVDGGSLPYLTMLPLRRPSSQVCPV